MTFDLCKTNKPPLGTMVCLFTLYSMMILFIFPRVAYLNQTSPSSTTKRVRQREFLRGGTAPAKKTTAPSTKSTPLLNITYDPKVYTKAAEFKPPCIVNATAIHNSTLIFLHGLRDTGSSWAYTMAFIRPPYMKLVCPTALDMPVPFYDGTRIAASWFDKGKEGSRAHENLDDVKKSSRFIHELIDNEVDNGIRPENIIVGGFSQGAAQALSAALSYRFKVGGIIAMSAWITGGEDFLLTYNYNNKHIPILQGHGDKDEIISYQIGKNTAEALKTISDKVDFRTYKGVEHILPPEGIDDIKEFLRNITVKPSVIIMP